MCKGGAAARDESRQIMRGVGKEERNDGAIDRSNDAGKRE